MNEHDLHMLAEASALETQLAACADDLQELRLKVLNFARELESAENMTMDQRRTLASRMRSSAQ